MKDTGARDVSRSRASETAPPRRTLRRLGAVLAGLLTTVILSVGTDSVLHATGGFPPSGEPMADRLFLVALAYRIVYGVAGGYIAARLAPDRPVQHALVLGLVGLVIGIVGTIATWNAGPQFGAKWYAVAVVASSVPSAWVGGKLLVRQLSVRARA